MSERFIGPAACVLVGGMTLAVPGATGFVAPAQRAVIKHVRASTRDASLGLRGPGLHQRPRRGERALPKPGLVLLHQHPAGGRQFLMAEPPGVTPEQLAAGVGFQLG